MDDKTIYLYAYGKTMGVEGGWANNPNDRGKETYMGIARKFWPNWSGWLIIDEMKAELNFPKNLKGNTRLLNSVQEFYYRNFWLESHADKIATLDADIAVELFDTAVNCGTGAAARILQQSLNMLNRNGKIYHDIEVDGVIGSDTFSAMRAILAYDRKSSSNIFKWMNIIQGKRYIEIMVHDPSQEEFARGWLKRIEIEKKPINFDSSV